MLTRILAAGLSSAMDLRIVAPSFVTVISPVEVECRILFMPFGPRVDLTRSPRASAPTKEERRACEVGKQDAQGQRLSIHIVLHTVSKWPAGGSCTRRGLKATGPELRAICRVVTSASGMLLPSSTGGHIDDTCDPNATSQWHMRAQPSGLQSRVATEASRCVRGEQAGTLRYSSSARIVTLEAIAVARRNRALHFLLVLAWPGK